MKILLIILIIQVLTIFFINLMVYSIAEILFEKKGDEFNLLNFHSAIKNIKSVPVLSQIILLMFVIVILLPHENN